MEQCGKIEKSLEDFRQGSDEMESSLLIHKTALGVGGGGRQGESRKAR